MIRELLDYSFENSWMFRRSVRSEFLRTNHRHPKIDEQKHCRCRRDITKHGYRLKFFRTRKGTEDTDPLIRVPAQAWPASKLRDS
jgi:hypothetical protein